MSNFKILFPCNIKLIIKNYQPIFTVAVIFNSVFTLSFPFRMWHFDVFPNTALAYVRFAATFSIQSAFPTAEMLIGIEITVMLDYSLH